MKIDANPIVDCIDVRVTLDEGIDFPEYKSIGAAGCDLVSNEVKEIPPGERKLIKTGLYLEIPNGFEGQVRPRSGLALNHGITVLNSPGTIDSDFRGEVKVLLVNHGELTYIVNRGERIAQLVFSRIFQAIFWNYDDLTQTARGAGGFGSTGV